MQLLDSESNVEMLQMETSTLTQKVEALEEECEERSHQANTWYQALQVRREREGGEVVGGVEEGTTSSFSSRNWTQGQCRFEDHLVLPCRRRRNRTWSSALRWRP